MQLKEVKISQIELNSPFFFRISSSDSEIYDSVKRMGILSPPIAFQEKDHFVPITGRSRLMAALKADMPEVPLMIFNELERDTAWKIAIEDAKTDSDLTDFEKASILKEAVFPYPESDHSIILKAIELKLDSQEKKFYQKINDLPNEVFLYASRYGLSTKQTKAIVKYPPELLESMIQYADMLSIRPVELLEMTGNIYEIHRGQSRKIKIVFKDLEFDKILSNNELNRNHKIEKIKKNIRKMRYPQLSELNDKLKSLSKNLPGKIRVKWDHTLESSNLEILIDLKNPKDLPGLIDVIKSESFTKTIRNMSDILNG